LWLSRFICLELVYTSWLQNIFTWSLLIRVVTGLLFRGNKQDLNDTTFDIVLTVARFSCCNIYFLSWTTLCMLFILNCKKMQNQKYHTVGTVPKYHTVGTVLKSIKKIVERGKIYTPKHIHMTAHFPFLVHIGTSIKKCLG